MTDDASATHHFFQTEDISSLQAGSGVTSGPEIATILNSLPLGVQRKVGE
jgi:hypothetical protein